MTEAVATVIPTYGAAPFLAETLVSLERQAVPPAEVVVVDDGSPSPVSVPPGPLRLKVLRIGHAGIAGARNAGVRATTAPLVHICDHDDLLEPEFYECMVDVFASRPSVEVAHAACGFIDGDGAVRAGVLPGSAPDYATQERTVRTLLRTNPIASVATVFRRGLVERLHGFRDLDFVQDWDFWLRAASDGAEFALVSEVLAWHRVHAGQQSSPEKAAAILREARRMLRSQKLPGRQWLAREQKIADLHIEEAGDGAATHGSRAAALASLALAAPVRPGASVRTLVRLL